MSGQDSPRFRNDLASVPAEEEGVKYVDVKDPKTGTSFRFYDFEFAIAQQLDGRPLTAVAEWAQKQYQLDLSGETLQEFIQHLREMGFLQPSVGVAVPQAQGPALSGDGKTAAPSTASATANAAASKATISPAAGAPAKPSASSPPAGVPSKPIAPAASAAKPNGSASPSVPFAKPAMASPTGPTGKLPPLTTSAGKLSLSGLKVPDSEPTSTEPAPKSPTGAAAAPAVGPAAKTAAASTETGAVAGSAKADVAGPPPVVLDSSSDRSAQQDEPPVPGMGSAATRAGSATGPKDPMASAAEARIEMDAEPPRGLELTAEPGDDSPGESPREIELAAEPGIDMSAEPPRELELAAEPPAGVDPKSEPPAGLFGEGSGPVAAEGMPSFEEMVAEADKQPRHHGPPPVPADASEASAAEPILVGDQSIPTLSDISPEEDGEGSVAAPVAPEDQKTEEMADASASGNSAEPVPGEALPPELPPLPPVVEERRQPPGPGAVDMEGFRIPRRSLIPILAALMLVAGIAAGVYHYYSKREAQPKSVRVTTPTPATVYRYFDMWGTIVSGASHEVAFPSAGKVTEMLPVGTTFNAGDVLGKLEGSAKYERTVKDLRARLTYYEQLAETMHAQGDDAKAKEAELKVAQKKKLIAEAEDGMKALVLTAAEPGEIVEVAAKLGDLVGPNTPVMKLKGGSIRAEFQLSPDDAEAAKRLGYCRTEVYPGATGTPPKAQLVDCRIVEPQGGKLQVELPATAGLDVGQKLRLAKARFDGVFPVPISALGASGDRLFVVRPDGRAEVRVVTVADRDKEHVLVSQGLTVGDGVILAPPLELADGARVQILR